MQLTLDYIYRVIGGTWLKMPDDDALNGEIREVSIDSRMISRGDIFFALKGQYFDGNDFAVDSLKSGAFCVIVERHIPKVEAAGGIIRVDDALEALQTLAAKWRESCNCPIVAVTGSSGKTTTKELIGCILSEKYRCLLTQGNMNNHIGVPLTLMRLRDIHDVGILELGMNQKGEIAKLTSIVRPQIGIITNIGKAHIGFLDSTSGILEAKAELLDGMDKDGVAVLNYDSPFYHILASRCRNGIVKVGKADDSDLVIDKIDLFPEDTRTEVKFKAFGESYTLSLPILGRFVAYNLLMAVAVAFQLGCGRREIESAISKFTQIPGRMYHHNVMGVHIIDDSYNSNPESVHLALKTLIECKGEGRSMAILGDMLELGNQAECLHRQLGQWLGYKRKVDFIITYGPNSHLMAQEAIKSGFPSDTIWSFDNYEEISKLAASLLNKKDWVLIKGSRQMGLDNISKRLIELISFKNGNKRNTNPSKKV